MSGAPVKTKRGTWQIITDVNDVYCVKATTFDGLTSGYSKGYKERADLFLELPDAVQIAFENMEKHND